MILWRLVETRTNAFARILEDILEQDLNAPPIEVGWQELLDGRNGDVLIIMILILLPWLKAQVFGHLWEMTSAEGL